jgi:NAD(P)-dependent dehydrogenase (short-subunit alcohol dehydrogenase family)
MNGEQMGKDGMTDFSTPPATEPQQSQPATKVALVTGASRGIGAELALALSKTHHVVAVARTTGALEELDDRIQAAGGMATLAPLNVTDAGAMQHLCHSIHTRWGHVDTWVHTAIHGAPLAPAAHVDERDFAKSFECNVTATQRLITYVEPLLAASANGTALFLDDDVTGKPFFGSYGASKAAQMALVKSWQAESQRTGPRVVTHQPKPMPSGLRARFFPGEDRASLTLASDQRDEILALIA